MLRVVLSIKAGRLAPRRSYAGSEPTVAEPALPGVQRTWPSHSHRVSATTFGRRTCALQSRVPPTRARPQSLPQWTFSEGGDHHGNSARTAEGHHTTNWSQIADLSHLCSLTRLAQTIEKRGESRSRGCHRRISPYLTEHINRFGDYTLNLAKKPPQPDYGYTLKQTASKPLKPNGPFVPNRCHTPMSV